MEGVKSRYRTKGLGSRFISRAVKTENLLPRSFFAPKSSGNGLLRRLLWSRVETLTPCAAGRIIFQRKNLNHLIVCITRYTLFFQYVCFLLSICLPCISCGTYCNEDKCCVVTHRGADFRVAWLVYLACLRSHLLRAYSNFGSKQAISITLFGRRPHK